MKLPTAITTKHKIRDSKILSLYGSDAWSMEEIGLRFGISTPRVSQIINKNLHLLKINREKEKIYRINKLKRILAKKGENCATKDAIDVMDKLREEIDGKDGSGSDQVGRGDSRVIIIRETLSPVQSNNRLEAINGDPDQSGTLSRSVSVVRV